MESLSKISGSNLVVVGRCSKVRVGSNTHLSAAPPMMAPTLRTTMGYRRSFSSSWMFISGALLIGLHIRITDRRIEYRVVSPILSHVIPMKIILIG